MEVDGGRKVRLPASHRSSKADIGRGIREAEMWVLLGVSGVMGAYHWGQGGSFRPRRRRRRRRWRWRPGGGWGGGGGGEIAVVGGGRAATAGKTTRPLHPTLVPNEVLPPSSST